MDPLDFVKKMVSELDDDDLRSALEATNKMETAIREELRSRPSEAEQFLTALSAVLASTNLTDPRHPGARKEVCDAAARRVVNFLLSYAREETALGHSYYDTLGDLLVGADRLDE